MSVSKVLFVVAAVLFGLAAIAPSIDAPLGVIALCLFAAGHVFD